MSEQPEKQREEQPPRSAAEEDSGAQPAEEQEHTQTEGNVAKAVGEADAYGDG
jgi:hypothetical protein